MMERAIEGTSIEQWLEAIQVSAMAANNDLIPEKMKQTLARVFPTQFYPGSMADRLLEEGREDGKLSGIIQTLQNILGDSVTPDAELLALDRETLNAQIESLQSRIRHHDA